MEKPPPYDDVGVRIFILFRHIKSIEKFLKGNGANEAKAAQLTKLAIYKRELDSYKDSNPEYFIK